MFQSGARWYAVLPPGVVLFTAVEVHDRYGAERFRQNIVVPWDLLRTMDKERVLSIG